MLVPWQIMRTVKGQKDPGRKGRSSALVTFAEHVLGPFFPSPFHNWFQRFCVSESRGILGDGFNRPMGRGRSCRSRYAILLLQLLLDLYGSRDQ